MVNSIRKFPLILFFLLALPVCIFARKSNSAKQAVVTEDSNEFNSTDEESKETNEVEKTEHDQVIEESWQTLEWEAGDSEFVLYYTVVIEKYNAKKQLFEWALTIRAKNTDTSVEIRPRQSPGLYRYKIVAYNLIGAPSMESEWMEFSIFHALSPRITNISSSATGSSTIYLNQYNDGVFTVEGKNLFAPTADAVLNDSEDSSDSKDSSDETAVTSQTSYVLTNCSTGEQLIPEILESNKSGRKIKMRFDVNALKIGDYILTATDASGLKTDSGKNLIVVKKSEGCSFDFSLGYAASFALYGGTYPEYSESKIYPYNAYAKMNLIFLKRKGGHFGVGLNAHANHVKFENSAYTIRGNTIDAYLNAIYQFPLYFSSKNEKKRGKLAAALEIYGGVGVLLFNDFYFTFKNNAKSYEFNSFGISVQGGADIQLFLGRKFFLEFGADYINAFMPDSAFGEVIPRVGMGWHL